MHLFSVRFITLLLAFSLPVVLPAQQKRNRASATADSLNTVSESYRYTSPATSAAYAQRALSLADDVVALRPQKVDAFINWSYALAEAGAMDSAMIIADSAKANAIGFTDSSARSRLLVLQGYLLDYSEKYEEALQFYFDGLSLCPDLVHRAAICNNIGSVYKVINDLDNAQKYYLLSYSIGVQLNDTARQAKCLNNLGGIFYSRREMPEALRYYQRSMQLREALFDTVGISSSLSNVAMVYEELGKPDSALLLYRRSLRIDSLSNRPIGIVISHINIGNLLFRMKKAPEAFAELQRAAQLSDSLHIHYYSRLAHRSLANYYSRTGNYKEAYANYVLYAAFNDSVLTEQSQKSTKELELRYRTRENAQQLQLLGEQRKAALLEKENSEAQVSRGRIFIGLLVGGALAVIFVAWLLFMRYRGEKLHRERLGRLVGEKDLLLREIHHRVKNNLQLVSSLLSMQEADAHTNGSDMLRRSQERIYTLALLHEQLYQSSDLKAISFRHYTQTLLDQVASAFSRDASAITIRCELEEGTLDIDQLVPCGLIINELVTNCYKHAFPQGKGTITVRTAFSNDTWTLVIADDGVGMESERKSESLGLRLIHGLARQLHATLTIETAPGKGTAFRITFRVKTASEMQPA